MRRTLISLLFVAIMITLMPASAPAPARAAGSLSVWTQSTAYKVQPTTAPGPGTAATMEGAQGAYESYQIVVHAGSTPLAGVNLVASALSDGNGHAIPASSATFYLETMIDFTGVSAIDGSQPAPAQSPTQDGRVPDPLVPFVDPYTGANAAAPFTVPANTNQPIWLDVAIPMTAAGGVYTGVVTVSATGETSVTVPVTLTVWSFALPNMGTLTPYFSFSADKLTNYQGGTYQCSGSSTTDCWFSDTAQAQTIMKRYQTLLHDSRIDPGQSYVPSPVSQNDNMCLPVVDWTAYDAAMEPYMDGTYWNDGVPSTYLTVPFSPGSAWGLQTCTQAQYTALAAQWAAHLKAQGWFSRAIVYAEDEPAVSDYPTIIEQSQWMINGDPDWRSHIMDTTPASTAATAAGMDSVIGIYTVELPWFDMWGHQPASAYPTQYYGRAQWSSSWAQGKQLWLYTSNSDAPPYAAYATNTLLGMEPQMLAWGSWSEGATGFLYWATDEWNAANPWGPNVDWGKTGDGVLVYPGNHDGVLAPAGSPSNISIDGPIPSYRLFMIREGLQDWALFNLAKQDGMGAYAKSQISQAYTQLGACTYAGCVPLPNCQTYWTTNATLMAQIRHNIAVAIETGVVPADTDTPTSTPQGATCTPVSPTSTAQPGSSTPAPTATPGSPVDLSSVGRIMATVSAVNQTSLTVQVNGSTQTIALGQQPIVLWMDGSLGTLDQVQPGQDVFLYVRGVMTSSPSIAAIAVLGTEPGSSAPAPTATPSSTVDLASVGRIMATVSAVNQTSLTVQANGSTQTIALGQQPIVLWMDGSLGTLDQVQPGQYVFLYVRGVMTASPSIAAIAVLGTEPGNSSPTPAPTATPGSPVDLASVGRIMATVSAVNQTSLTVQVNGSTQTIALGQQPIVLWMDGSLGTLNQVQPGQYVFLYVRGVMTSSAYIAAVAVLGTAHPA